MSMPCQYSDPDGELNARDSLRNAPCAEPSTWVLYVRYDFDEEADPQPTLYDQLFCCALHLPAMTTESEWSTVTSYAKLDDLEGADVVRAAWERGQVAARDSEDGTPPDHSPLSGEWAGESMPELLGAHADDEWLAEMYEEAWDAGWRSMEPEVPDQR